MVRLHDGLSIRFRRAKAARALWIVDLDGAFVMPAAWTAATQEPGSEGSSFRVTILSAMASAFDIAGLAVDFSVTKIGEFVKTDTLEKSPVEVVMPEVKLTIADLAYMTGLMPGSTRCAGRSAVTDKLLFLGLIEMASIPPCAEQALSIRKARYEWQEKTRSAVRQKQWHLIETMPYNLRPANAPKPTRDYILTNSGRKFIATGRAKSVTSTKSACLK